MAARGASTTTRKNRENWLSGSRTCFRASGSGGGVAGGAAGGLDGPAIYNLEGRESRVLKHRDGRLSPFKIHTKALAALLDFTEYRIRQIAFDKIVIEFGGRSEINTDELAAVTTFLQKYTGPEFNIEIKACEEIDWGQSRKRPAFRCEV